MLRMPTLQCINLSKLLLCSHKFLHILLIDKARRLQQLFPSPSRKLQLSGQPDLHALVGVADKVGQLHEGKAVTTGITKETGTLRAPPAIGFYAEYPPMAPSSRRHRFERLTPEVLLTQAFYSSHPRVAEQAAQALFEI